MEIILLITVAIGTIAVMALVAFLIFRHEIKKETQLKARSLHDTAYGKDTSVTGAAADATLHSG